MNNRKFWNISYKIWRHEKGDGRGGILCAPFSFEIFTHTHHRSHTYLQSKRDTVRYKILIFMLSIKCEHPNNKKQPPPHPLKLHKNNSNNDDDYYEMNEKKNNKKCLSVRPATTFFLRMIFIFREQHRIMYVMCVSVGGWIEDDWLRIEIFMWFSAWNLWNRSERRRRQSSRAAYRMYDSVNKQSSEITIQRD